MSVEVFGFAVNQFDLTNKDVAKVFNRKYKTLKNLSKLKKFTRTSVDSLNASIINFGVKVCQYIAAKHSQ